MNRAVRHCIAAAIVAVASLGTASAQSPVLRVCGDPDNLPYSNEQRQGFENKVAEVVAADLGATLTYAWWPHQRGLVRNTIDAGTCDVIFGVPADLESVLATKAYYRASYVIAYREDRDYRIESLDSAALKALRLGVHANTPPEESLARRGLHTRLTTYSLFFDPRGDRDRPAKLLADLADGAVDVAFVWGPLAGYYAKTSGVPLAIIPLQDEPGVPLSFDMSMGVKRGNGDLKRRLDTAIDRRQAEIRAILEEFGVPLMAAHASRAQANPPERPGQDSQPTVPGALSASGSTNKLNPFTGNAEMIQEGRKLYMQVGCQGCHGGGGGGGMAVSLIDDTWKFGSDDQQLLKLVKGQVPGQTMPTVYSTLADDQVWKILAFIRSLYIGNVTKINW